MAGSVNKVLLVGNLGKDPEVRTTQAGDKIVSMTIATSETWTDKGSGERKERTEWHRIVCYNDRISDFAERYLRKGVKVWVEGSLQTRKWTDQQGQEKYTTEVVVGRFRGEIQSLEAVGGGSNGQRQEGQQQRSGYSGGGGNRQGGVGGGYQNRQQAQRQQAPAGGDLDDEIPF